MMSKLLFTHSTWCVNLVPENEERNLGELLNGQKCVELSLRLRETLVVGAIYEEDNAIDLREVVTPQSACCKQTRSDRVESYESGGNRKATDLAGVHQDHML